MDMYLTSIIGWGPNWAPRQFLLCAGQLLPISQFTAVFSLIGTIYGGDGRTTFALPDLRGRNPLAAGSGPGLPTYQIGQRSGATTQTLTVAEMPAHSHSSSTAGLSVTLGASTSNATSATPVHGDSLSKVVDATNFGDVQIYGSNPPNVALSGGSISGSVAINNTGGGRSFSILQPILAIQFIFCMQGIFPPRS